MTVVYTVVILALVEGLPLLFHDLPQQLERTTMALPSVLIFQPL